MTSEKLTPMNTAALTPIAPARKPTAHGPPCERARTYRAYRCTPESGARASLGKHTRHSWCIEQGVRLAESVPLRGAIAQCNRPLIQYCDHKASVRAHSSTICGLRSAEQKSRSHQWCTRWETAPVDSGSSMGPYSLRLCICTEVITSCRHLFTGQLV